jgi:hypothetical protein
MKQEYVIKSVQSFPFKKGYVAIFLSPRDKIENELEQPCPFRIHNIGPSPMPKEIMQTFAMQIESMMPKQKQHDDFRDILLVVTETDFYGLGWAYGDVISGDFKKTQDGESINPFDKEEKIK